MPRHPSDFDGGAYITFWMYRDAKKKKKKKKIAKLRALWKRTYAALKHRACFSSLTILFVSPDFTVANLCCVFYRYTCKSYKPGNNATTAALSSRFHALISTDLQAGLLSLFTVLSLIAALDVRLHNKPQVFSP